MGPNSLQTNKNALVWSVPDSGIPRLTGEFLCSDLSPTGENQG